MEGTIKLYYECSTCGSILKSMIEPEGVCGDCKKNNWKPISIESPTEEQLKEYLQNNGEQKKLQLCYNNIKSVMEYYMDLPEEKQNIIALWIMGTYYHNQFNTYPYLFINAMRGSGKTRLLKIVESFSKNGQLTMNLTDSVLFRTTGTLLLDEFEGITRKGGDTLRELLNSAYKKGTKIFRMKKKKGLEGEEQVVELFQPYRPVVMANIWGMEEVLGDRCITTLLEKSDDLSKIKLIEDFSRLTIIEDTKNMLLKISGSVVSVDVVSLQNIQTTWNVWVKTAYTLNTHTTLTTLTTHNYTDFVEDEILTSTIIGLYKELYEKIDNAKIDGRNLELFFPLFMMAGKISNKILDETILYAKKVVSDKKTDEASESKDVMVYKLVARSNEGWIEIKDLTNTFRLMLGDGENEWVNSKWLGRSLKRLNLIKEKRRIASGMSVILDINKAMSKECMFK